MITQSEITSLVLKLQNLLLHQGLKDDNDFPSDADSSDAQAQEKDNNRVSKKRKRPNLSDNTIWRCPKCRSKPRTFTKHFDLLRHYAQRREFPLHCGSPWSLVTN